MKIIRDNQLNGLLMIPLFQQYNISRCNVDGCKEKPSTIITDCVDENGDTLDFSLCETHFQEAKVKGRIDYHLTFEQSTKEDNG
jgi:hypothetical protein